MMAKQLHVVSTGKQSREMFVKVVQRIHKYVDAIHIREKTWPAKELTDAIHALIEKEVPPEKIIVNDRIDVAYIMKITGVQLAHHSVDIALVRKMFPSLQIGSSVHSSEEAIIAEEKGASHIFYGHIFPTASKPGVMPRGLENLQKVTGQVMIPVIAIGGITPENTKKILATRSGGIAVLSGILLADDPLQAAKEYRNALDKAEKNDIIERG